MPLTGLSISISDKASIMSGSGLVLLQLRDPPNSSRDYPNEVGDDLSILSARHEEQKKEKNLQEDGGMHSSKGCSRGSLNPKSEGRLLEQEEKVDLDCVNNVSDARAI